jgi:hypothetical protein
MMAAVIDLSATELPPAGQPPPTIDPREPARRRIAYTLLSLLGAVIGVGLVVVFIPDTVDLQRAKDLLGLVLTPMVGLVGSVIGFYFSAQTAQESGGSADSDSPKEW